MIFKKRAMLRPNENNAKASKITKTKAEKI